MAVQPVRVLIVDDSTVFRSQVRASLEGLPGVENVGYATNGRLAIDWLKSKSADLITLDMEMPEMDGLATLRELARMGCKAKVIVFSSTTLHGAEATLAALREGASDFLAKPNLTLLGTAKSPAEAIRALLEPKIRQFFPESLGGTRAAATIPLPTTPGVAGAFPRTDWRLFLPKALVIASSTGGPTALEKLFSMLRPPLQIPIFITQHMPPVFTASLAERIARVSGIPAAEAKHQEMVQSGRIYLAPGDYHLRLEARAGGAMALLDQGPQRNSVRPAADFMFESAVPIYSRNLLGVVLTGMGADGRDGAVAVKRAHGGMLIQDKASCVVFGMPGAVHEVGAYDEMGTLETIASRLVELGICSLNPERKVA